MSSLPQAPFTLTSFQWQDKFLHFIAYTFYGSTLALAVHGMSHWSFVKRAIIICMVGILYAASDEIHQSFVPGRTAEWGDLIADYLGIFFSMFMYRAYALKKS